MSAWGRIGHCLGHPAPLAVRPAGVLLQVTTGLGVSCMAQRWDLSYSPLGPCSFSPDTTTLLRASSSQPREGPQRLIRGFLHSLLCKSAKPGGRPALPASGRVHSLQYLKMLLPLKLVPAEVWNLTTLLFPMVNFSFPLVVVRYV